MVFLPLPQALRSTCSSLRAVCCLGPRSLLPPPLPAQPRVRRRSGVLRDSWSARTRKRMPTRRKLARRRGCLCLCSVTASFRRLPNRSFRWVRSRFSSRPTTSWTFHRPAFSGGPSHPLLRDLCSPMWGLRSGPAGRQRVGRMESTLLSSTRRARTQRCGTGEAHGEEEPHRGKERRRGGRLTSLAVT